MTPKTTMRLTKSFANSAPPFRDGSGAAEESRRSAMKLRRVMCSNILRSRSGECRVVWRSQIGRPGAFEETPAWPSETDLCRSRSSSKMSSSKMCSSKDRHPMRCGECRVVRRSRIARRKAEIGHNRHDATCLVCPPSRPKADTRATTRSM